MQGQRGPSSFRTIALCANDDAVLGAEYADGSGSLSYDNCDSTQNMNSALSTGTNADWGILLLQLQRRQHVPGVRRHEQRHQLDPVATATSSS